MSNPTTCPRCGSDFPARVTRGLCPRCLLRQGFGDESLSPSGAGELGATMEFSESPRILAALSAELGAVPRVLLRDSDADPELPVSRFASSEMPNLDDRVDRLRLLGEIARGGMGAVLKGRDEDLGRDIAVKVLLEKHRNDPGLVRRFIEEARIGGQLQHPGIVPVYQLGAFADRRPYFAMKLVRGQTLSTILDARTSPIEGLPRLLGIFEQIGRTVAYAHARGVIHRDLKPSNIMVGDFGEVQVMDWGLAKVLTKGVAGVDAEADTGGGTDREADLATAFGDSGTDLSDAGSIMGTPAYMAPEQARGEVTRLDERADVFALGSILCEILTGRPAIVGRSPGEIQSRAARGATGDALAELDSCGADAELVVLARDCLAVEPENRPRDARAVGDRTTAYLVGVQEKLRASERERAVAEARAVEERRKRRWQLGLAASVAAFLVLGSCGLATFTAALDRKHVALQTANKSLEWQQLRAESREQMAIASVSRFRDVIANEPELKNNPALADLQKRLLSEPLGFFQALRDRLENDRDTRPESLYRLAHAEYELGRLTDEIGEKGAALAACRESRAILQRLADANPGVIYFRQNLAGLHINVGNLLSAIGEPDEALEAYGDALAIQRQLTAENPDYLSHWRDLAGSYNNIGLLWFDIGEPDRAMDSYEGALAIRRRLVRIHPDAPYLRADLAGSLNNLANLLNAIGEQDESLAAQKEAMAIRLALAKAEPEVAEFQADLATSHFDIGNLLADVGEPSEALDALEKALAIRRNLAEVEPAVIKYRTALAHSHNAISNLLHITGHPDEALAAQEEALAIRRGLAEADPAVPDYRADLAESLDNFGNLLNSAGEPDKAMEALEEAMAIWRGLASAYPHTSRFRADLAECCNTLGILLGDAGRPSEALDAFEEAMAIRREIAAANPTVIRYRANLAHSHNSIGLLLKGTGEPDEASRALGKAADIFRELVREHPDSPNLASFLGGNLNNIAMIDLDAGRFQEARTRLREAIEWQRKALDANPAHPIYRRFLGNHLRNLIAAARGLDDPEGVADAELELKRLGASNPAAVALQPRVSIVIASDREATADEAERLRLEDRVRGKSPSTSVARFQAEVITADPT